MIVSLLKDFKYSLSMQKYKKYIPKNYTMDDVFLVSYPKSGNTWLRFLIANAIKNHYEIDREINFFSIQDVIPDNRNCERAIIPRGPFGKLNLPRIIKSHANYNPYYCRVFLLVRDPRDVMVSYFNYLKGYKTIPEEITFGEFIRHKDYGVDSWLNHTKSWYSKVIPGQNIQLFLYEDLIKNTHQELKRLMNLYGINIEDNKIEIAVKSSSKENMRKSAAEHESTYKTKILNNNFVGKATINKGNNINSFDREFIEDKTVEIASKLGYEY